MACCGDAASTGFRAGISVARHKDAAAANFMAGVSAARCEDAAVDNFWFSGRLSVTRCKDAALLQISGRRLCGPL